MTRRTVLQILAGFIHAAMGLALSIPALRFLAHPLKRKRRSAEFMRIAPLSAVPPHAPIRVAVSAVRVDGFLNFPSAPIGQVWLDRPAPSADGSTAVRCLQTICPHLGCAIDLNTARTGFTCPCHASDFTRDGARRTGPAPRSMDELECRVSTPDTSGERWVEIRYQEFRTGIAQREFLS